MTYHRYVLHHRVPDYLLLGWMAFPTLDGTHHGFWSVHCAWLCECEPIEPPRSCPLCGQSWFNCGETMCPQPKRRRRSHMDAELTADGGE